MTNMMLSLVRRHHAHTRRDQQRRDIQQPITVKQAARVADAAVNRVVDARGNVPGLHFGRKCVDAVEVEEDIMPFGHRHHRQRKDTEREQQ